MKRMICGLMVLAVVAICVPVEASYYVAGGFNSWGVDSDIMTDNGDGTYSLTVTGLDAGYRSEFKITDGTWTNAVPGANSWFYADENGEMTITLDTNTYADGWNTDTNRIILSDAPTTWTIAGDMNGWSNSDTASAMTDLGNGIYLYSATLAAGTYYCKPVVTGTWDSIGWYERSINTSNLSITTYEGMEDVNIYVDALNGTVKVEMIPEPATMGLLGLGGLLLRRRK